MQEILAELDLSDKSGRLHCNLSNAELIERALKFDKHPAKLTDHGALAVETGAHTGRSANDKYVVKTGYTSDTIDWTNNVHPMDEETFKELKAWVLKELKSGEEPLYLSDNSVGAHEGYNMSVRLLTPSPAHALFGNHMFRSPQDELTALGQFTVWHAPFLEVPVKRFKTKSSTAIVLNLDSKEVLICGTRYAGEIKKSIFSIMNFLLPEFEVLPTHSGANLGKNGDVSLFFGLSGTGKTTLSADVGRLLIGDDEHGVCPQGTFNFEGGCYAKTIDLKAENEPEIYGACERFGTILENVVIDQRTRKPDFTDKTLTENGRASYPLDYIPGVEPSSKGPVPEHIFFLSADAFGVLPALASLNPNQAMYYFLSGYTAKLAGTEVGVLEPSATFSHCFGAPFMMRRPEVYAKLLKRYMDQHNIQVWLINTGWTGGAYGVGHRFPLKVTRGIIRSVQAGEIDLSKVETHPSFGFAIPKSVPSASEEHLFPWKSWASEEQYFAQAKKLASMFHENFRQYQRPGDDILAGAPL